MTHDLLEVAIWGDEVHYGSKQALVIETAIQRKMKVLQKSSKLKGMFFVKTLDSFV